MKHACVYGVPHALLGEVVKAVVVAVETPAPPSPPLAPVAADAHGEGGPVAPRQGSQKDGDDAHGRDGGRAEGRQLTARMLRQHCAARLADFKVPRTIEFLRADELPMTGSGKVPWPLTPRAFRRRSGVALH